MKATHIKCLTWIVWWSIKSIIAVAGDSAGLVASVHLQEEVPGVMGREVQSEQQQEEQCHFVTTYTIHRTAAVSLNTMNLDQMAINYSINHSI